MSEPSTFVNVYSDVNFLPDWYADAQRHARARKGLMVLAGLVVVGMIYGLGMVHHHVKDLRTYHAALQERAHATESTVTELAKLQADRESLSRQVELHRKLQLPINYSQVAGTLARLTPEQVALISLSIETKHVTRKVDRTKVAEAREVGAPKPKPVIDSYIELSLVGMATTDVIIANYVGALATSGLFDEVKMVRSRMSGDGPANTREFEIDMRVPLDRQYRSHAAEEVADAR